MAPDAADELGLLRCRCWRDGAELARGDFVIGLVGAESESVACGELCARPDSVDCRPAAAENYECADVRGDSGERVGRAGETRDYDEIG